MKLQTLLERFGCAKFPFCLAVASSCLAAPGASQEEIKAFPIVLSPTSFPEYDWTPDIDGDGHWDLIVGDAAYSVGPGLTVEGRAYVLSGRSGSKVYEYIGGEAGDLLGFAVAGLGHVDADTTPDFSAVGGDSFVWSGADGSELYSELLQNGAAVAPLGDLNADGFDDFALRLNVPFVGGEVRVVYGGTFASPFTIQQPSPSWTFFGVEIEVMDDVNDDGVPDIAVGAPGKGTTSDCSPGYVGVFSGSDGQRIYSREGDGALAQFGAELAAPGDLNGDGVGDLVVGSPMWGGPSCFAGGGSGRVYFLDGKTGAQIDLLDAPPGTSQFGTVVSAAGDANGNGVPDVYIFSGPGYIFLIDGSTRETIYQLSPMPTKTAGFPLGVKDLNNDEFPDFFAVYSTALYTFSIGLYSGAPIGVTTFGVACGTGGQLPRIGATGSPRIGKDYDINLSNVVPGLTAFLAIGFSNTTWMGVPLPFDLGVIGMAGCDLSVSPDAVFTALTREVTPGLGAATVDNAIPNDPALLGSTVYAQWLVLSAPGSSTLGSTTRGLAITFL